MPINKLEAHHIFRSRLRSCQAVGISSVQKPVSGIKVYYVILEQCLKCLMFLCPCVLYHFIEYIEFCGIYFSRLEGPNSMSVRSFYPNVLLSLYWFNYNFIQS